MSSTKCTSHVFQYDFTTAGLQEPGELAPRVACFLVPVCFPHKVARYSFWCSSVLKDTCGQRYGSFIWLGMRDTRSGTKYSAILCGIVFWRETSLLVLLRPHPTPPILKCGSAGVCDGCVFRVGDGCVLRSTAWGPEDAWALNLSPAPQLGSTPLQLALEMKHEGVAKLLQQARDVPQARVATQVGRILALRLSIPACVSISAVPAHLALK